jgi:hypothetical protein
MTPGEKFDLPKLILESGAEVTLEPDKLRMATFIKRWFIAVI